MTKTNKRIRTCKSHHFGAHVIFANTDLLAIVLSFVLSPAPNEYNLQVAMRRLLHECRNFVPSPRADADMNIILLAKMCLGQDNVNVFRVDEKSCHLLFTCRDTYCVGTTLIKQGVFAENDVNSPLHFIAYASAVIRQVHIAMAIDDLHRKCLIGTAVTVHRPGDQRGFFVKTCRSILGNAFCHFNRNDIYKMYWESILPVALFGKLLLVYMHKQSVDGKLFGTEQALRDELAKRDSRIPIDCPRDPELLDAMSDF